MFGSFRLLGLGLKGGLVPASGEKRKKLVLSWADFQIWWHPIVKSPHLQVLPHKYIKRDSYIFNDRPHINGHIQHQKADASGVIKWHENAGLSVFPIDLLAQSIFSPSSLETWKEASSLAVSSLLFLCSEVAGLFLGDTIFPLGQRQLGTIPPTTPGRPTSEPQILARETIQTTTI